MIPIHYADRGTKPVDSDDGVNWEACNSGLPPDPSTMIGGANTQGMNIDPATGYVYIVRKNADVYRTTVPQSPAEGCKNSRSVQWHSGSFFHIG